MKNKITWIIIAIITIWGIFSYLMFFSVGSGEHDTFMMAAGMVHGLKNNMAINYVNYGNDSQFLFYYIFHYIFKGNILTGTDILIIWNVVGALSALIIPLLLYCLLKCFNLKDLFFDIAPILLLISPAYAFTIPYGHPFHIAFTIALSSLIILIISQKQNNNAFKYGLYIVSIVLQSIALSIRVEQVLFFWFCIIGLYIYAKIKDINKWMEMFIYFIASSLLFLILHKYLVPTFSTTYSSDNVVSYADGAYIILTKLYNYAKNTYALGDFVGNLAYHITDIGLPIIFMSTIYVYKNITEKKYYILMALLVSAGPSFFLYLTNAHPPRHSIITIIALSIFIAINLGEIKLKKMFMIVIATITLNMIGPPFLNIFDPGGEGGQRRTYTYNFIQRHGRNKVQIKTAMEFYNILFNKIPEDTVLFANWIHIAQISMMLAPNSNFKINSVEIIPGVKAVDISYKDKKIFIIECYALSDVEKIYKFAKIIYPNTCFISIIGKGQVNELELDIPQEIDWWSS
jgi:hypothetical protein